MKTFLETYERQFTKIHSRSCELIEKTPDAQLFRRPRELDQTMTMFSIGEYVLRSAGAVEQTFGGITTRLWDDPFEWTLPEKLSSAAAVAEYLAEADATRVKGFAFFASDEDLKRQMPAPEKLKTIFEILLETVARAEHFQGRAFAVFQVFSDGKLPRF